MSHTPSRRSALLAGLLVAGTAAVALPLSSASAADTTCSRFASPSGSDSASGTSSSPFRTVQKLNSSLGAGQTGCLQSGTYSGNLQIGTDGVTLRSAPGARATLSTGTIEIRDGADGVTLSDLNIVGSSGLTLRPIGDRFALLRNDITNNHKGLSCVLVGAQSAQTVGGTIVGNRIHDCGVVGSTLDHGIYAQNFAPASSGQPGLLIQDNVFFGLGAYAVQLYPNGTGGVVKNNVIDGGGVSTRGGIVIDGSVARSHVIEQNIVSYSKVAGTTQRTGSDHRSTNNCYFSNSGGDVTGSGITRSGDINADPQFVDRANRDYRLRSGSPCLSKVGYDTAAKNAGQTSTSPTASPAPTATQAPAPTASPAPTATQAPAPTASPAPTATQAPNTAPKVSVTSPTSGAVVTNDLRAVTKATDDGRVVIVDYLIDGKLVASETSAPYDQWISTASLSVGKHVFSARAVDDRGLTTKVDVSFSKR